ncbi:MAG: hypothetical protein ACREEM_04595 [Blastocatellia bacterium]
MLTARQFSERAQVSYPTVLKWLREGLIPDAKLNEKTPLGTYWEIPATSVGKIAKQKPGPKPRGANNNAQANRADALPASDEHLAPTKRRAGKAGVTRAKNAAKKGARAK